MELYKYKHKNTFMTEPKDFTIEFLKIIADATRLEILDLLKDNEKTSAEIQEKLNRSQSTVSKHLSILTDNRLISSEKKGNLNYYKVKNSEIFSLLSSIKSFVDTLNKEKLKDLRDIDVLDTLS